ncbi:MAG: ATP-binding protein [bacterium]|nr:ATP-binding protein [bacterium]
MNIYIFNLYFPVAKTISTTRKALLAFFTIVVILSPFSFIAGNFYIENGILRYLNGPFSILLIFLVLFVLGSFIFSNSKILRDTNDEILKRQVKTISAGLGLTIMHAILFLIVLPSIFGNENISLFAIGYLAPYFYLGSTVYSLVNQKLFDIRLIIARTVGYLLSLGFVSVVIGIMLFITLSILDGVVNETVLRIVIVFITVLLAITYGSLKSFFDRITNKLFYRDAYETKDLIDEFNTNIVAVIDLKELLSNSAKIIEKYLKSNFVSYALVNQNDGTIRLVREKTNISKELIEHTRGYMKNDKSKVFITDILEEDKKDLKSLLTEVNVGMAVRITSKSNEEGIGYILMGYKKTGSVYTSQDTKAMEIIANELAIATQNALRYEEIQQFNVTLQDKVDDATKQLRKANERLKQLDQTKDDFISMASHQLRTPLTSVKGYVSMVIEGDAGKISSKQKDLLDQAFLSSQRMVYLIADLLNVSRLRTGKFVIESKETNLADVIEGEIKQLEQTAKAKEQKLTYNKPKNFPTLMFDETKMRQVIMNFADNAVHYVPTGGKIDISLEDKGDSIEFRVEDNGIGVPKNEQHNLFNKFFRAKNAKKARPDGTGLGLFMAKKVIVAQGGAIIFKSTEDKGSTFGFTFAKKKVDPANYKPNLKH